MPARKGDDGGYVLPEVIDPQRIRLCIEIPNDLNHIVAFWGAMQELGHAYSWQNDDAHTALQAAAVWQDVYRTNRANYLFGDCKRDEMCQTYPMTSPRITWFPENPFNPLPEPPEGYLVHPFTVVTTSIIDSIISVWGLGYQVGDVYTDLLHIPAWEGGEDPVNIYNDFPYFRVNDLNGTGTVKLHLLNLPQGGRFLLVKDDVIDLFNLQLVETNKDNSSIPAETQVPQIIEVEFTEVGNHHLDVVWLPVLDDVLIPIHFGGGVRKIEICGFGLEGCDDVAKCCPDDTKYLRRIYQQNNQYMSFIYNMLDDGETANSFVTDAPEYYDSNTGDDNPNARTRALCAAVTRYVWNILSNVVEAYAASDLVTDILAILPPFGFILGIVDVAVDIVQDSIAGLVGDEEAVNDVICHMLGNLTGQPVTQAAFRDSVNPSAFTPLSNQNQIAVIIDIANASKDNWRAFTGLLPELYETISQGGAVDCPCDCDDDIELVDWYGTGTVITPMGDCIYKFYNPNPIFEEPPDVPRYYHSFRDTLGRCLYIENSPNPSYPTTGVGDHWVTDCEGDDLSNIGGFTPATFTKVRWRANPEQFFKVTLAE